MTAAQLALAIQAAYVRWHQQGRLDMRFYGPPPLDDEPDETEQFAADVLSYLPLAVKEGEPPVVDPFQPLGCSNSDAGASDESGGGSGESESGGGDDEPPIVGAAPAGAGS